MHLWSELTWYTLVCAYACVCVIMGLSFFHVYIKLFVCEFLCEIPLGAVAPEGRGCPPVSWQSSGSHGNEARDAPALDLWCSPPPEELQEKERERGRWRVKQSQSLRPHLKFMHMSNLRGAARIAETEVGQRKSWYEQLRQLTRHSSGRHFAVNLTGCSTLEQLHNNFLPFPLSAHLWVQVYTHTHTQAQSKQSKCGRTQIMCVIYCTSWQ